jgi:hypothetical protein
MISHFAIYRTEKNTLYLSKSEKNYFLALQENINFWLSLEVRIENKHILNTEHKQIKA